MVILLIGGSGFIGSHIAEILSSEKEELITYDRSKVVKNDLKISANSWTPQINFEEGLLDMKKWLLSGCVVQVE